MTKFIQISSVLVFFLFGCDRTEVKKESNFQFGDTAVILSEHPRLFFLKDEEAEILNLAKEEPLLNQLVDVLHKQAEEKLTLSLQQPNKNGEIDLGKSREQISRMLTLSLAYRLFDDKRYAEKVEQELINVCKFKSWHPQHFLDVAEMTTAVAIGYDWCFNALSTETRNIVEQAIRDKAFAPAWPVYETGDESSWAKRNTNWNVVCNSGLVNGALAVAETFPADAARIIQYAIQYTPNNIEHFAPNGVYYEGPAYWNYTCSYLMLLLDNLQRNLGSDFGLSEMPGVKKTMNYYIKTLSPTNRVFNFADAHGTEATYSPVYFFFSRKFNQPGAAEFYRGYLQEAVNDKIGNSDFDFSRFFFLSIPWYDNTSETDETENEVLKVYKGEPDILVFNGHVPNPNALYLIAKGGDPDMAHNQLDVGSFVVESQQIRWGVDLGSENYSLPSFWDYKPDGIRWDYFINNNLSHNTLNIDGKIANSRGNGILVKSDTESAQPFGVFDLSSSYIDQATSVLRGFRELEKDIVLCRDEVSLDKNSKKVNWRFITDANVVHKKTFIELSKNGKTFYLYPFPVNKDEIKTFEAKTNSAREKRLSGITVIEITAQPHLSNHVSISVLMGNDFDKLILNSKEKIPDLNDW